MRTQSIVYSLEVYRVYGPYKTPETKDQPKETYSSNGPFGSFNVGDTFSENNFYCGTVKHVQHDIGKGMAGALIHTIRLFIETAKNT
ncbi:MAG TPA: hypothetical protein VJA21_03120 [Verrucomicrobiae bacterium]